MASLNASEDSRVATDIRNIARRQHRIRRIAATLVVFTLLGGTGMAITASSASAEPNSSACVADKALYDDQIIYVGYEFGTWTTAVLLSNWADAARDWDSYTKAYDRSQEYLHDMQADC